MACQLDRGFILAYMIYFMPAPLKLLLMLLFLYLRKLKIEEANATCTRSGLIFVCSEKETRIERQVTASGNYRSKEDVLDLKLVFMLQ